MADAPPSKRKAVPATAREPVVSPTTSGIMIQPRVIITGGVVASVGIAVLAFFVWMVPNAAAREVRAACTELTFDRDTGHQGVPAPAVCNGQPCTLPTLAPDFTAIDHNGKPVKLSDFRGKVVLVNFWASWCGVCKEEKPNLRDMAADLAGDDFVVIALASDHTWADALAAIVDSLAPNVRINTSGPKGEVTMKDALDAYRQGLPDGTPFKVLLDPPAGDGNIGTIAASWGIKQVPESALIDRQGNIRAYIVNKRDWQSPVAETCLRSLIDE
jgi:thiol-disulfide isomerase/thioredoxin